uniref:Uncharacterized protein n=1 Tax=Meloidogyne enterolobii TaxID=390850 RepID=A0A6V7TXI1_MELEN|nr:unnamed protein product [Meloidogyne enterolobii]
MAPTYRQEWSSLENIGGYFEEFPLDRVSGNPNHHCYRKAISRGNLRRDSSHISPYFWEGFCLYHIKNTQNRSKTERNFIWATKVGDAISPQNGPIFSIRSNFYRIF